MPELMYCNLLIKSIVILDRVLHANKTNVIYLSHRKN